MTQTKETKGKAETFRITGKNYDAVIRQVADKYHSGNGWSVVRTIDRIITMDVYVERNSEQGVEVEQVLDVVEAKESTEALTETPTEVSGTDKVDTKTPSSRKPVTKTVKATKEVEK